MLKFLNLQSFVWALAAVGAFVIGREFGGRDAKKDLKVAIGKVVVLTNEAKQDSATIAEQEVKIFDLQGTVDASKGNDAKMQVEIGKLRTTNEDLRKQLAWYDVNGNVQYYEKGAFERCFRRVMEKPKCVRD